MSDAPAADIVSRVIGVIAKSQHVPSDAVRIDSTFEELKIDSLDGINLVFALESEFDITIPDEGAQNLRTVRETVEGVEKLLREKAAPV